MKKLLSLSSILTINGTAVPITTATSSYQKEKNKKNNNIQTNISENLSRNKRDIVINGGKGYWIGNNNNYLTNTPYKLHIDKTILSMAIVVNETTGELKRGSIYFGTTDGVYYKKHDSENIIKIPGLNEAIQSIQLDHAAGAWVVTENIKYRNVRAGSGYTAKKEDFLEIDGDEYKLKVSYQTDGKEYIKILSKIRSYLRTNGIINLLSRNAGVILDDPSHDMFIINKNSDKKYFIVSVVLENDVSNQSSIVKIVFSSSDLYIQGFIVNNNNYYFREENNLTNIPNYTAIPLFTGQRNTGVNYNDLIRIASGGAEASSSMGSAENRNLEINWANINLDFELLTNLGTEQNPTDKALAKAIIRIVFITAEAMRFREVNNSVKTLVDGHQINWWDFYNLITNWQKITKEFLDYLDTHDNLNDFEYKNKILIFSMSLALALCSVENNNRLQRSTNSNFCYQNEKEKKLYYDNKKRKSYSSFCSNKW